MPYLTKGPAPTIDASCGRISVPAGYLPVVVGALTELLRDYNWEAAAGGDTVEEAVEKMTAMLDEIGDCTTMIGQVVALATEIVPDNMLPCDGQTYYKGDYEELWAVINPAFIIGPVQFKVPDLRAKVIVGEGDNHQDTPRDVGDYFGEEHVTLDTDTMPVHSHTADMHTVNQFGDSAQPAARTPAVLAGGTPLPYKAADPTHHMRDGTVLIHDEGAGDEHQNMQPGLALFYGLVFSD